MPETTDRHAEVFDEAMALSKVGGDREFLAELVGLVQAAWPALLADIREEMALGDHPAVGRTARLAKAAARYVSAQRAYDSAAHLEAMIGMGDLRAAQSARTSLEQEVERLQMVLSTVAGDDWSS